MLVELIFHRNMLNISSGEVHEKIEKAIQRENLTDLMFSVKSVTMMSRWLVVLIEVTKMPDIPFAQIPNAARIFFELCCDTVAGIIVCELQDYAVRYRHFTVVGEGESLIFKEKSQP